MNLKPLVRVLISLQKYILGATAVVDTGLDEGTGFAVKDFGGCVSYKGSDFTAVIQRYFTSTLPAVFL